MEKTAVTDNNAALINNAQADKVHDDKKELLSPSPTTMTSSSSEGPFDQGDAKGFNFQGYQDHLSRTQASPHHRYLPPIETLTGKDDSIYNLNEGVRLAVVFNHCFYKDDRMDPRSGTDHDVSALRETFQDNLDFELEVHENPTVDAIFSTLIKVQERQDLSCLALFILTHGEEDGLLHAYDSSYRLNKTIIPELLPDRCPHLAGRPKLIFIQACQGDNTDAGIRLVSKAKAGRMRHTSADSAKGGQHLPYCIPNYCDMLIFAAAYTGQYSFRSARSGSWFIQALCRQINEAQPDEDLVSVLTKVSRYVALYKESNIPTRPELHRKKQVPLKQDTLIRKIYLKGKINPAVKSTVDSAHPTSRKDNCLCM